MDQPHKYNTVRGPSATRTTFTALVIGVALLAFWRLLFVASPAPEVQYSVKSAVAVLKGDAGVSGTVYFEQASAFAPVVVSGSVKGLDANAKRGFHIHQLGDATNGCTSAGAHFNPFDKPHGAPTDAARHVGDLGNIQTNASGAVALDIEDAQLTLNGLLSIVGRSVVVHAGTDDLGKGGDEESLKTGNAGARAACGVIGVAELV